MSISKVSYVALVLFASIGVAACGPGSQTGGTCEGDQDCYENVDVRGQPICFSQVEDGYCSHTCDSAADCCAADGECDQNYDYICTGLESRSGKFCFIECSNDSGSGGDNTICKNASRDLECRNTGRGPGSKACLPSSGN